VKAILSLIDFEKRGGYPGGQHRRLDRYLWMGSIALHWIRKWLAARKLRFIPRGAPMLAVASIKN
jgi:hypothetical protein